MSTQDRSSEQGREPTPDGERTAATPQPGGESTNLLQRWVRLVQSSSLWGNDAGQLRLDELASGPNTPQISTLEEIRAARAAVVAEEEAAEGAGNTSWWEDAVCAEAEPEHAEMPPIFTLPPLVAPPVLPAVGEGLLSRILAFGGRWLGPVVAGMWPKDTAPPELTDRPYMGMNPGVWPEAVPTAGEDNKCKGEKVKHRGGEEIHNKCADSIPGNAAAGGDWKVTTPEGARKNFDAYTPGDNTVWEVKTNRLSEYPLFLQEDQVNKQVLAAVDDNKVAERCGYRYAFQVSDPEHYRMIVPLLAPLGIDVVFQPECLRKQGADSQ